MFSWSLRRVHGPAYEDGVQHVKDSTQQMTQYL
jgi:hypothetical protein